MFLMHILTKPGRRHSAQLSRISVPNLNFISDLLKVSLEVFRIYLLPETGKLILVSECINILFECCWILR